MNDNKKCIIIESPGKIKQLKSFLPANYIVKCTNGHVQDLYKNKLSVEISNDNIIPSYRLLNGKNKVINEFKKIKKDHEILLALDNDNEGEFIAFSLYSLLKLNSNCRIIFNDITKQTVQNAINNKKEINNKIVEGQKTRRIIDRLIGYNISPLLWNIDKKLKAIGRLQISLLNHIISTKNNVSTNKDYHVELNINGIKIKKDFTDETIISNLSNHFNSNSKLIIKFKRNKNILITPKYPFITSTILKESYTDLNFDINKTMKCLQTLYENGFITYIRTDSYYINPNILNNISSYISNNYEKKYSEIKQYTDNKYSTIEQCHECIRPVDISIKTINLNSDCSKLYNLIRNRTLESQMIPSNIKKHITYIDIQNDGVSLLNEKYFEYSIDEIIEQGYLILYDFNNNKNKNNIVETNINENNLLFESLNIFHTVDNTSIYLNESNLIDFMSNNKIGRPSTYNYGISKLYERKYITKQQSIESNKTIECIIIDKDFNIDNKKETVIYYQYNKILPTNEGIIVSNFMNSNFNEISNINFTSKCEEYIENVINGTNKWTDIIKFVNNMINSKIEIYNTSLNSYIGTVNGYSIFTGCGKYGPYVKTRINGKWIYKSISKLPSNYNKNDAYTILLNGYE